MSRDDKPRAVVLLSGGLDSTTCLAYALNKNYRCYALSVNYGQKHSAEIEAARRIATRYACEHRVIDIDVGQFGGSALTDDSLVVPTGATLSTDIPITYVPARNTVMLAVAMAWAESLTSENIFIGVNAVDYSGYPDCRPEFIEAFNSLAKLATKAGIAGSPIQVSTPLLHLTKREIIELGISLGVDYALTVTCYQASESGAACGQCDACQLRKAGFEQAGISDPTIYY